MVAASHTCPLTIQSAAVSQTERILAANPSRRGIDSLPTIWHHLKKSLLRMIWCATSWHINWRRQRHWKWTLLRYACHEGSGSPRMLHLAHRRRTIYSWHAIHPTHMRHHAGNTRRSIEILLSMLWHRNREVLRHWRVHAWPSGACHVARGERCTCWKSISGGWPWRHCWHASIGLRCHHVNLVRRCWDCHHGPLALLQFHMCRGHAWTATITPKSAVHRSARSTHRAGMWRG